MTCSFGTVTFVDVLRWWFVHWEDRRCWHRLSRCPRMMEAALGSRSRWRWCSRSSYRSHSEPPDFGGTPQWYHIIFFVFSRRHWLSELLLPWLVLLASRAAIAIPLQCFADNVLVAGSQSLEVDPIFDIRLDQTDLIKQRVKPISAGCRC